LPYQVQARWRKEAVRNKEKYGAYPDMDTFVAFLNTVAHELNDPVFGEQPPQKQHKQQKQPRHKSFHTSAVQSPAVQHTAVQSPVVQSPATVPKASPDVDPHVNRVCLFCKDDHYLASCPGFGNLDAQSRFAFVKENKLCFNCLKLGRHRARYCRIRNSCSTCNRKHNSLLHEALSSQIPKAVIAKSEKTEEEPEVSLACGTNNCGSEKIALPVVPVKVKSHGKTTSGVQYVQTYALLDPGSNKTFCSIELLKKLDLKGKEDSLSLSTLNETRDSPVQIVELEVTGTRSKRVIHIPRVYALEAFPSLMSSIAEPDEIKHWDHLQGIPVPDSKRSEVLLLIGQDVPQAMIPLEVRHGRDYEPYAVRTHLGWVINGPVGQKSQDALCNFIHGVTVNPDEELRQQVESFWKVDDIATENEDTEMSLDEKKVLEIWDKSLQITEVHYQIDIPFKSDPPQLIDNKFLAERRLKSLGRRLSRDVDLMDKYKAAIDDLVRKGYAEPVPDEELDASPGRTWYLPHHCVINPNKEKIRVVFDCSAKSSGLPALNSLVYKGPDLSNNLLGVLMRFREDKIAIMGDIEEMFHQVKVSPHQRDALRFLWWQDGDQTQPVKVYKMTVHLFRGIWSPSAANYALHRAAIDQADHYDELIVKTVLKNFYQDDCLKSMQDEDAAIELIQMVCEMLSHRGFRLTKWVSSSKYVMMSIPESERSKNTKDLNLPLPVERALGVQWRIPSDELGIKVKQKEKPLTRRGLLSIMSSVYDPFGFVSPVILLAKLIFQAECKTAKGWDEELEPENRAKWEKWLQDLPVLEEIATDRCVVPDDFGKISEACLHHFCDASEKAYGAVTYLRLLNDKRQIHCVFMLAKSRLAPIKIMTIPRLELSAAVLAVQMDSKLRKELKMNLGQSVFWTDSTTVIQYLKNTTKRFKTFVANRVSRIHNESDPVQWHHVGTTENPADDISRGLDAKKIVASDRWKHGPQFIWKPEEHWNITEVTTDILEDDVEVKQSSALMTEAVKDEDPIDKLLCGSSSWFQLKRSVCWLRRFLAWLPQKTVITEPIAVSEMDQAEKKILQYIQKKYYSDEVSRLKKNKCVGKSSSLYPLEPMLDDQELLRLGGRLAEAPIPYDAKYPYILPRDHHVAELVVRQVHEEAGHSGREHILSQVRERFWIPRGRPLVKKVL